MIPLKRDKLRPQAKTHAELWISIRSQSEVSICVEDVKFYRGAAVRDRAMGVPMNLIAPDWELRLTWFIHAQGVRKVVLFFFDIKFSTPALFVVDLFRIVLSVEDVFRIILATITSCCIAWRASHRGSICVTSFCVLSYNVFRFVKSLLCQNREQYVL